MALSRLGWRSVAASMTARNGLSFSEITLRRVALVVIVNPRLKRLSLAFAGLQRHRRIVLAKPDTDTNEGAATFARYQAHVEQAWP